MNFTKLTKEELLHIFALALDEGVVEAALERTWRHQDILKATRGVDNPRPVCFECQGIRNKLT